MVKWYALFGAAVLLATCVHAQDDSFDDIFAPLMRSEISLPTIIPLDSLFSAPRQESNPFVASSSLPRMTVRIIPITSGDDMEGGLRGMQAGARSGKTACVPCNMMRSFSSSPLDGSAMSQGPMGDMLDDLFSFHQGRSARTARSLPRFPALPSPFSSLPSSSSSSSSIFSSLPRGGFKQTTIVDDGKTTKTTTITTDEKGTETHTTETRDSDGASRPNGLNSVMRFSTSGPTSPQRSMDVSPTLPLVLTRQRAFILRTPTRGVGLVCFGGISVAEICWVLERP